MGGRLLASDELVHGVLPLLNRIGTLGRRSGWAGGRLLASDELVHGVLPLLNRIAVSAGHVGPSGWVGGRLLAGDNLVHGLLPPQRLGVATEGGWPSVLGLDPQVSILHLIGPNPGWSRRMALGAISPLAAAAARTGRGFPPSAGLGDLFALPGSRVWRCRCAGWREPDTVVRADPRRLSRHRAGP